MSLITWNMQGATSQGENIWTTGIVNLFNNHEAKILALQECGDRPGSAVDVSDEFELYQGNAGLLRCFRWTAGTHQEFHILHWRNTDHGMQSLAIVWSDSGITQSFISARLFETDGRPVLCMAVNVAQGTIYRFCSIHGNNPFSAQQNGVNILQSINGANGVYDFVVGDWNMQPHEWPAQALYPMTNWKLFSPDHITQHCISDPPDVGLILDYLIVRNWPENNIQANCIQLNPTDMFNLGSDHCPVSFQII